MLQMNRYEREKIVEYCEQDDFWDYFLKFGFA